MRNPFNQNKHGIINYLQIFFKKIISCEIFSTSFVNKLNEGFNRYAICNRRIPIKPLKIEIINI